MPFALVNLMSADFFFSGIVSQEIPVKLCLIISTDPSTYVIFPLSGSSNSFLFAYSAFLNELLCEDDCRFTELLQR